MIPGQLGGHTPSMASDGNMGGNGQVPHRMEKALKYLEAQNTEQKWASPGRVRWAFLTTLWEVHAQSL